MTSPMNKKLIIYWFANMFENDLLRQRAKSIPLHIDYHIEYKFMINFLFSMKKNLYFCFENQHIIYFLRLKRYSPTLRWSDGFFATFKAKEAMNL